MGHFRTLLATGGTAAHQVMYLQEKAGYTLSECDQCEVSTPSIALTLYHLHRSCQFNYSPTMGLGYEPNTTAQYIIDTGQTVLALSQHELLGACWNTALDTPCSVCGHIFNNAIAPPVRTLSLRQPPLSNASPIHLPSIRTINTHLECLKAKGTRVIPVSHAWHEPVARAYASREVNIEAARMVFELPVRMLVAASQRFGPDVQIWHDYISIPQWQDGFRGTTILPQIFKIFSYGGTALIHLDDEPTFNVRDLSDLTSSTTHMSTLRTLFSARWFHRMWIIVEYTMCQDSYLVNSRFEIMSDKFSCLIEKIMSSCHDIPQPIEWMSTVPLFVRERSVHNCLGHVYSLLADQGCRSYRDYFIAACAILEQSDDHRRLSELPSDTQEACLWVSKRALERGDYSPLILRPTEEPQYAKSRWLKGHTAMDGKMWGLGVEVSAAHFPPLIVDDDSVQLEAHLLGTTTQFSDVASTFSARCERCKAYTRYEAEIWQPAKMEAQVYHIKGLAYKNMPKPHIGIIVDDNQVIGRAWLDEPGCECTERARIWIN